ncbi:MAG: MBL fold metallo-hydrolase [Gammaproteobacteria bacterium]|nr:MBL fold metallo-hydrolase [Gammaproteobacteria bacterium]
MYRVLIQLLITYLLLIAPVAVFADYMRVTLLGTGSPRPDVSRSGPAVLVEAGGKYLLFDAGRGVVDRLNQLDIPASEIHQVFLTHLHSDHISALDDLWMTGWIYQRQQPLAVYGPDGTESFTQQLQQAYAYDAELRHQYAGLDKNAAILTAHDIKPGVIYAENGVKVTAFLVDHKPVDPAYGYRIDFGERSVVISGDTTYSDNLIAHAQDVDLLIHEIFAAKEKILGKNPRLQKIERYHTNPTQLSRVLDEITPRMTILTHVILIGIEESSVITQLKDGYTGEIRMGEDLIRLDVGSEIKVAPFKETTHQ